MLSGRKLLFHTLLLSAIAVVAAQARAPMRAVIACDDQGRVYVNGESVGEIAHWEIPLEIDLGGDLLPIVVAVEVRNAGGAGALLGALKTQRDGVETEIGARWRCSSLREDAWFLPGFDDGHWSEPTEIAPYGAGPWLDQAGLGLERSAWVWVTPEPPQGTLFCRWRIEETSLAGGAGYTAPAASPR